MQMSLLLCKINSFVRYRYRLIGKLIIIIYYVAAIFSNNFTYSD